jgi:hypothetical protein
MTQLELKTSAARDWNPLLEVCSSGVARVFSDRTQGSSRDEPVTADIEGAPHSPAYCHHFSNYFLPSRSLLASPSCECWQLQQNGRSHVEAASVRPEQSSGCTYCHSADEEDRSKQKSSLCPGQQACARTSRRIFTRTSNHPDVRAHAM